MKLGILVGIFSTVLSLARAGFPQLSRRVFRVSPSSNQSFRKLDSVYGISNHAMCAKLCKTEQCLAFSYKSEDRSCETYSRFFEESTYVEISHSTSYFNKVIYHCTELSGYRSGVYKLGKKGLPVYCDIDTEDGPWTVIQRRTKGDVEFYRRWIDYKNGFGDLQGDFWLVCLHEHSLIVFNFKCNDNLHILTNNSKILRVEIVALTGENGYAEYSNFQVADEFHNYKLLVNGYSGNLSRQSFTFGQSPAE